MPKYEVLKRIDLDPDADEELYEKMRELSWEAMAEHAIVHIEIRKLVE